jgi:hypothetical protein
MIEARQRPGEADSGVLPPGKQHKRLSFCHGALCKAFREKTHGIQAIVGFRAM